MEFYENFISKVQSAPTWSDDSERILVEPYTYLASVPGKEVRSALMDAFNAWIQVPAEDLAVVKKLVGMLHTASLLMDDVEDDSHLRRGMPVAHKIYGIPQTINSANYVYFLAYQELQRIKPRPGVSKVEEMVTEELLNLHRGQGMDLFWRENLICPTEPEYIDMVNNSGSMCICMLASSSCEFTDYVMSATETGGLFRIAIKLMMAASTEDRPRDYVPLANLIGIIFQIRDDYVNLQSAQYAHNKGYCEDLSEGKFSFPIVHAIRSDTSNRQLLNILRERPSSPSPKAYAVHYMTDRTKSFAYTRQVLSSLMTQAREEVQRLGGNQFVDAILDQLVVKEEVDPATQLGSSAAVSGVKVRD
ncbi:BZ3500_MvSof-1268-A1-R1_Chr1-3g02107 [Microbotryum saponariae]|uniref:(2E,6E)-farnesyl diphosphate synthase n=1 Tax=Microbotryum saponariae TaxID=289078 RepID=A0A2X0KBD2_9BASI|nr:BZ3500_MvSof-1268-A1-R1_Chr1-3g02107 [Microbotryum saponariae]SCZ95409.1 BZ3501_MvSof-1269-A2-R1_Chr1-3g01709 [Microbotryum saponariae]